MAAGVHGEELLRGAVGDLLGALGVVRLDEVDHRADVLGVVDRLLPRVPAIPAGGTRVLDVRF